MTHSLHLFAEIAAAYCALIERHHEYTAAEFVAQLRDILPQLYYRALKLPDIDATDEKIDRDVSHEEWTTMHRSLQRKLGINDHYWEVYDPLKLEYDEPVAASLSDDLADIWRDLTAGVSLWGDCSDAMQKQIVWDWHFSFHYHWSDHAVDALRAIHWIAEHYGVREV